MEKIWFLSFKFIDLIVDDIPFDVRNWQKRENIIGKQMIIEMDSISQKISNTKISIGGKISDDTISYYKIPNTYNIEFNLEYDLKHYDISNNKKEIIVAKNVDMKIKNK